jgi:C1A family cysteine protease
MMYHTAILSLLATLSVASAALFTEDTHQQKYLWEGFKKEHGKDYDSMDVELRRFQIFIDNLKMVDSRNAAELAAGGSAVHGITTFLDLTQLEFESKFLTSDPALKTGGATVAEITTAPDATAGLVDWTGKFTTPVKNQQQCGSCWAFSATEQIESDAMRTLGVTQILSPEQITQCDATSFGCDGGWTERAYSYVQRNGGITTESNYPYTSGRGVTGTCNTAAASEDVIKVNGYTTIKGESAMASYTQSTGPLSVCIDATTWNSYTGGIMKACGTSVDHCVQAVGVDASSGGYWKVRNSWGTSWGESGFIRLAYGANTCDITNDPTYVSVSNA